MNKYNANSYSLIFRVIIMVVVISVISYLIIKFDTPFNTLIIALFTILALLFFAIRILFKMYFVEFNEDNIVVTYLISKNIKLIQYHNLVGFHCIDGQGSFLLNIFKYKNDNLSTSKIKVDRFISNEEFLTFTKWLKSKNNRIKIKVTPQGSKLSNIYYSSFN